MAETTGPINGTLIKLYKGTVPIANLISNDFNIDMTIIDVSSKSSGAANENITGRYSWGCGFESITEFDGSVGTTEISWQDILTDIIAGTSWTVVIGSGVTGDPKLTGTARISATNLSAPDNDKSTFSSDLQGTGALTVTTF